MQGDAGYFDVTAEEAVDISANEISMLSALEELFTSNQIL